MAKKPIYWSMSCRLGDLLDIAGAVKVALPCHVRVAPHDYMSVSLYLLPNIAEASLPDFVVVRLAVFMDPHVKVGTILLQYDSDYKIIKLKEYDKWPKR